MPFIIKTRVELACDICGLAPDHFVDVEVFDVCQQARNWGWHVSETRNAPGTEGIEVYCPTCWECKQWIDRYPDDPLDQPIDLLDRQEKRDKWRAKLTSAKAESPKTTLYTYGGKPVSKEEFEGRVYGGR